MTARALRMALLAAVLAVAAAYFILAKRSPERSSDHPQEHSAEQAPAPKITISGNYSDDWMKYCGPAQGAAQQSCTAGLDAAYGRSAGQPVPPDAAAGRPKGQ